MIKIRKHHSIQSILIVLSAFLSINCSRAQVDRGEQDTDELAFVVEGDEVILTQSSIFGLRGSRTKRLKPKDIKSFQWIDGAFSKDKYFVYYQNKILASADPETFTCLSKVDEYHELDSFPSIKRSIGIDKHSIFIMPTSNLFLDSVIHDEEIVPRQGLKIIAVMDDLNGVFLVQSGRNMYELRCDMYGNPEIRKYPFYANEYKLLGGRFVQSGHNIYAGLILLEDVSPSTFKAFGNSQYYANEKNVYLESVYETKQVMGADVSSFEVHPIINFLARDKNNYYYFEDKIDSIRNKSVKDYFEGKLDPSEMESFRDEFKRH